MAWIAVTWQGLLAAYRSALGAGERGAITTGIVAVSLLGSSAALGGTLIAQSDLLGQQLDSAVRSAVNSSSGVFMVRGSVIVTASGVPLTPQAIQIELTSVGLTPSVSADPAAANRLVISYTDSATHFVDVPFTLQVLSGNGDTLLDAGEFGVIMISLAGIGARPASGDAFTLEIRTSTGVATSVTRRLPPGLNQVMQLP